MSVLSIFIDESGDFGPYEKHSPYYLIALVFHDQAHSIDEPLNALHKHVKEAGFTKNHAIHTAPLIRREGDYTSLDITVRRKLFRSLFNFMRQCDINYHVFLFQKKQFKDHDAMLSCISKEVGRFVQENLAFFQSYSQIIVYYDNGQKEITNVINTVFNVFLDAEVRKVRPSDYALFQTADLLCTLKLISEKLEHNRLSNSESKFFLNTRSLKKNYLKPVQRKRMN